MYLSIKIILNFRFPPICHPVFIDCVFVSAPFILDFLKGGVCLIDTIKILTPISRDIAKTISLLGSCLTKTQNDVIVFQMSTMNIPSYSTNLHISIDETHYSQPFLVVEGSPHKIFKFQNAYDGFYNLKDILYLVVDFINKNTNLELPYDSNIWFVSKVDITKCYDLGSNEKVCNYINSLSFCSYPRRKNMFFEGESIYFAGTTNTLKIYNKLLECKKNDFTKLKKLDFFDLESHLQKISGYIRFECSIKSKTLRKMFYKKNSNENNSVRKESDLCIKVVQPVDLPRVSDINYSRLEEYWQAEFFKLLKVSVSSEQVKLFNNNQSVFDRLCEVHTYEMRNRLYSFYLALKSEGYNSLRKKYNRRTFYRYIKSLKEANINISSKYAGTNTADFNVFDFPEVL